MRFYHDVAKEIVCSVEEIFVNEDLNSFTLSTRIQIFRGDNFLNQQHRWNFPALEIPQTTYSKIQDTKESAISYFEDNEIGEIISGEEVEQGDFEKYRDIYLAKAKANSNSTKVNPK